MFVGSILVCSVLSCFAIIALMKGELVALHLVYSCLYIRVYHCTRGIWKVLSKVSYLSNPFTNPIMFGIILKSDRSSML